MFAALLAKRVAQIRSKASTVGIYVFCLIIILLLVKLFWPTFSETGDAFFDYYGVVFTIALIVLNLFLFVIWVIAGFKTHWRPRTFEAIPILLLISSIISVSIMMLEIHKKYQWHNLPICEQQK
ncbi:hypothetical protein [Tropicibacter sp. Alg240-R139]|uniref:hypothetical protein n=1 Tax=Tropicibacter sp. Alg240-R139 TaxID=2305991 RepID=UPI0013E073E1|nr:hypothetical protein [Tropicibacter sp. Alg240-R139]